MFLFFFFNDTATTEIYTLSLHDALPISIIVVDSFWIQLRQFVSCSLNTILIVVVLAKILMVLDRKSTRLNSSHQIISYAVFCLKKKKVDIATAHVVLYLDLLLPGGH